MPGMTALSLSRGTPQIPDRVIPLYAGKVHVGQLSLAVGPGLEPLGRADQRLLDALGHVLASSAYNLGLTVSTCGGPSHRRSQHGNKERRRIRPEIHDGICPLLAAAPPRTQIAHGRTSRVTQPGRIPKEAAPAAGDRTERVSRSLVEGLRPPALDHGGLVPALQQHAEHSAVMAKRSSPTVSFEVRGDLAVLPAAVEEAAYRIAQEAISNATKHAGAQHIDVLVSRTPEGLTLEIDDDGVGVGSDVNPSGVGLASMTERATELGGWCTNDHLPTGGTRVKAWLPITVESSKRNRLSRLFDRQWSSARPPAARQSPDSAGTLVTRAGAT